MNIIIEGNVISYISMVILFQPHFAQDLVFLFNKLLRRCIINLIFYPFAVVSRYRDPEIKVRKKYLCLYIMNQNAPICTILPFNLEFTNVIFIHYKPRMVVAILDL